MSFSAFRRWLRRFPRPVTPRHRPIVERLEDRSVPSTFTVTDLGDAGVGSGLQGDLRYAITTANANDEASNQIEFAPGLTGTITLTQGLLTVTKSLEIDGPGQDLLTISGNHQSGILYIISALGDPQTVSLSDLTLADGTGVQVLPTLSLGGALYNSNSVVTLTRCTLTGSSSDDGGAIYSIGLMMELDACRITDNHVSANGGAGGIDNEHGTMTLTDTTVSGNTASFAAGVENRDVMTFSNGTIADNVASGFGGGIDNLNQLTVTDSTISGNQAGGTGGGVANAARMTLVGSTIADNSNDGIDNGWQMVIRSCTIVGNTSTTGGGGLAAGLDTVVYDSTIVDNSAPFGAGVTLNEIDSRVEIIASTITGNHADGTNAGGISRNRGLGNQRLVLDNTIVAENTNDVGPADVVGQVISEGYNLIGAADGSSGWANADQTGTADAPLDPLLGPLQDNGGPTLTRAPYNGSPAINAGDPALALSRDQRGSVRQAHATRSDIGAVEPEGVTFLRIRAPAQVAAGEPFAFTVVALDVNGNTATTYPAGGIGASGTVHFTSSDPAAQLPDAYRFTPADQGVHTFTAVLATPGDQTIQVEDTGAPFNYHGTATVTVSDTANQARLPLSLAGVSLWGAEANGWDIPDALAPSHKGHKIWWAS